MSTPAVAWFEISGGDGPALQRFYGELFGWEIRDAGGDRGYGMVAASKGGIGGGIGSPLDGGVGRVTLYVDVDDLESCLERVERLGGRTVVAPTLIPEFGLAYAFFADPEGHVVGLSKTVVE